MSPTDTPPAHGDSAGDDPVIERFVPPSSECTAPFWEATRRHVYLVQWCVSCDVPIFYPREACPHCLMSDHLVWRESSGAGRIHACSVQHRPAQPGLAGIVPYGVALVDVDAGGDPGQGSPDGSVATVRIMSNIVDADLDAVRNGDPVTIAWEPLPDGRNLAVFRPV